jgi:hypothetical protein
VYFVKLSIRFKSKIGPISKLLLTEAEWRSVGPITQS